MAMRSAPITGHVSKTARHLTARVLATAVVAGVALVGAGGEQLRARPQQPPSPGATGGARYVEAVPSDPDNREGWTSMFDGATLSGWDGPRDLWRVENGAIVVRSVVEPPTGPAYLLWEGGEPGNFELLWDLKLEGVGANSGVQFRATRLGEVAGNPRSRWETRGYQADVDNANANTGALIECCRGPRRGVPPRSDRAFRGQVVRTAVADGQAPTLVGAFDDPARLATYWRVGDWNRLHLIARDRTMTFFINGQLMSVLIDDHPTMFVPQGVIAIQLEGRGENTAQFRNLWIKTLP